MAAENKELMRQALEDVSPSVLVSVRDWLELGEIELGKTVQSIVSFYS